jgi:hypothetical protein
VFASSYFPNAYFPKTYYPECTVAGTVVQAPPGTFSNSKISRRNKRGITVAELLRQEREETQLRARQQYDGKYIPVVLPKVPTVYTDLSERSKQLIAELDALAPQQDAELIRNRLRETALRLFLLGLYG